MAKKGNLITIEKDLVTPTGTVKFSNLIKPNTRFNEDGVYDVSVVFKGAEEKRIIKQLQPLLDQVEEQFRKQEGAAAKKKFQGFETVEPWQQNTDKEGNELDGVVVRFKTTAKEGKTVTIVDAKRNPLKSPKVGYGSEVKVAFTAAGYAMADRKGGAFGLTLYLNAVQVLELKSFSSGADAFSEEEGYEVGDSEGADVFDKDEEEEDQTDEESGDQDEDEEEEKPRRKVAKKTTKKVAKKTTKRSGKREF